MRRLMLCLVLVLTALGACSQSADGWRPTPVTEENRDLPVAGELPPDVVGYNRMKVIAQKSLPGYAGKAGPLMVVVKIANQFFLITYLGDEIKIVELNRFDWEEYR